jgi:hypothetical protein
MINAKQSHEQKEKPATEVPEKTNKKPQASKTYGTDRIGNESDDDALCGFTGIAQVRFVEFEGERIQNQQCRVCYHEKCVAAGRRKVFACGKCN